MTEPRLSPSQIQVDGNVCVDRYWPNSEIQMSTNLKQGLWAVSGDKHEDIHDFAIALRSDRLWYDKQSPHTHYRLGQIRREVLCV